MFAKHELPQSGVADTRLKLEKEFNPGQLQGPACLLQSAQVIIEYWVQIHDDEVWTRALVVLIMAGQF